MGNPEYTPHVINDDSDPNFMARSTEPLTADDYRKNPDLFTIEYDQGEIMRKRQEAIELFVQFNDIPDHPGELL